VPDALKTKKAKVIADDATKEQPTKEVKV